MGNRIRDLRAPLAAYQQPVPDHHCQMQGHVGLASQTSEPLTDQLFIKAKLKNDAKAHWRVEKAK